MKKRRNSIYLIRVLTFLVCMSYIFLTAALIFFLSARMSTMKTRVLLSSIFFIALSVVNGYLSIWKWSSLHLPGALMRGYLGFLGLDKVFGLWNVTDVRIFLIFFADNPAFTALAVFKAWALGSAFLATAIYQNGWMWKPQLLIWMKTNT